MSAPVAELEAGERRQRVNRYRWRGFNRELGRLQTGELDAPSENAAHAILVERGIDPLSVYRSQENSLLRRDVQLRRKIPLKDLAWFLRKFALAQKSGIRPYQALVHIGQSKTSPLLAAVVNDVADQIRQGVQLQAALEPHAKALGPLVVPIIRAGEQSGRLEEELDRLIKITEDQVELRRAIRSAMTYPIMVISILIAVMGGVLLFVVPRFKQLYTLLHGKLPAPTEMVIGISNGLVSHWYAVFIVIGLAAFLITRTLKFPPWRRVFDMALLRLPRIGDFLLQADLARVTSVLASMIEAGVPVMEGLKIASDVTTRILLADGLKEVRRIVMSRGALISTAMKEYNQGSRGPDVFPDFLIQIVQDGEESSGLPELLFRYSDAASSEVKAFVDGLKSIIEPLLMAVIGVGIGAIVVALYLPMFRYITLILKTGGASGG